MSEITLSRPLESRTLTAEHATLFIGAALFMTILSPFRTDLDLAVPIRFLYWFGIIFGGTAISLIVASPFQRHAKARTGFSRALIMSAQVLAASIPITLLVAGMEMWLREPFSWAELPQVFPYVATITAVITAASSFVKKYRQLKQRIRDHQTSKVGQPRLKASPAITRFHLRLDPPLRHEEILMLKAEDHYLRVQTSKDTVLIRCTLAAAIDELGNVDGQRIHRSFWVARSAILMIKRHGNAYRLIMRDGKSIPLSRRRRSELSKRDWFPT
jgi:DNA-binding LytR/AlgR family response regulator